MINDGVKFGSVLEEYFSRGSEDSIKVIISPFITVSILERLMEGKENVIILTSWRLDHLRSGVSSLELFDLCKRNGWKLFINDRLHAKIYSNDYKSCYIGSANVTDRALYDEDGNVESLIFVNTIPFQERVQIQRLILQSILVDDVVYTHYKLLMEDKLAEIKMNENMSAEINVPLHLYLLPASEDPHLLLDPSRENVSEDVLHDLALYTSCAHGSSQDRISDIRSCFLENPFIKKIESEVSDQGLSFGKLTQVIHSSCIDIPTPYRSDIKKAAENVLNWFRLLFPDKYEVKTPGRHSQVLFKK